MQNTGPDNQRSIHVAVGVIDRINSLGQREILLSKRAADVHQGGLWEFPGGKVEPEESVEEALARELWEELGIIVNPLQIKEKVKTLHPLIQIEHDYGDKKVLLDVWEVKDFKGEPVGKEGQKICWALNDELASFHFPLANKPIVKACKLPRYFGISPEYNSLNAAIKGVGELVDQRLELISFRQPQLSHKEYAQWAAQIQDQYASFNTKILLSGDPAQIENFAANGIHAPFSTINDLKKRPISNKVLFGVSCHSEEELRQAETLDADFVTLSPVSVTPSHPNADILGWDKFENLVGGASVPIYALGGMGHGNLQTAINVGAQGIAGIRLWQ